VFELTSTGSALVKANDTGTLDDLVPKPEPAESAATEEAPDGA
jgi:hypothetical protein